MSFAIDGGASGLVTIYADLETGERHHAADLPRDKVALGTVEEIMPILPNLNAAQLNALSGIEVAGKNRATLLDAIALQLAPPAATAATAATKSTKSIK